MNFNSNVPPLLPYHPVVLLLVAALFAQEQKVNAFLPRNKCWSHDTIMADLNAMMTNIYKSYEKFRESIKRNKNFNMCVIQEINQSAFDMLKNLKKESYNFQWICNFLNKLHQERSPISCKLFWNFLKDNSNDKNQYKGLRSTDLAEYFKNCVKNYERPIYESTKGIEKWNLMSDENLIEHIRSFVECYSLHDGYIPDKFKAMQNTWELANYNNIMIYTPYLINLSPVIKSIREWWSYSPNNDLTILENMLSVEHRESFKIAIDYVKNILEFLNYTNKNFLQHQDANNQLSHVINNKVTNDEAIVYDEATNGKATYDEEINDDETAYDDIIYDKAINDNEIAYDDIIYDEAINDEIYWQDWPIEEIYKVADKMEQKWLIETRDVEHLEENAYNAEISAQNANNNAHAFLEGLLSQAEAQNCLQSAITKAKNAEEYALRIENIAAYNSKEFKNAEKYYNQEICNSKNFEFVKYSKQNNCQQLTESTYQCESHILFESHDENKVLCESYDENKVLFESHENTNDSMSDEVLSHSSYACECNSYYHAQKLLIELIKKYTKEIQIVRQRKLKVEDRLHEARKLENKANEIPHIRMIKASEKRLNEATERIIRATKVAEKYYLKFESIMLCRRELAYRKLLVMHGAFEGIAIIPLLPPLLAPLAPLASSQVQQVPLAQEVPSVPSIKEKIRQKIMLELYGNLNNGAQEPESEPAISPCQKYNKNRKYKKIWKKHNIQCAEPQTYKKKTNKNERQTTQPKT